MYANSFDRIYSFRRRYGSNIPFNALGYMVIEVNKLGADGRRMKYDVTKLDGGFFLLNGPHLGAGVRVNGWADGLKYLNSL